MQWLTTIDLEELDSCRKAMRDLAGQFGGVAGEFARSGVPASAFGAVPAAAGLAGRSQDLHTAAATQYLAAQQFLHSVGQGLSGVGQRANHAETTNAAALKAV